MKIKSGYINSVSTGSLTLFFGGGDKANSTLHVIESIERGVVEYPLQTPPRTMHAGCIFNGYYAIHGGTANNIFSYGKKIHDGSDLVVINPSTLVVDHRKLFGQVPTPRVTHRMEQLDANNIILLGGMDASGNPLSDCYAINMTTFVCTRLPDLSAPASSPVLSNVNGRLFLFGGYNGSGFNRELLEFNAKLCLWERYSLLPFTPRKATGYAICQGYLFCFGGRDKLREFGSVWVFSPNHMDWYRLNIVDKVTRLFGPIVFFCRNMLYVGGGATYKGASSEVFEIDTRPLFRAVY